MAAKNRLLVRSRRTLPSAKTLTYSHTSLRDKARRNLRKAFALAEYLLLDSRRLQGLPPLMMHRFCNFA